MNWDQTKVNWKQVQGLLKQKWGKLSGDDLAVANGDRDILLGKLQEQYGYSRDEAGSQLDRFISAVEPENRGGPYDKPEVATEGAPVGAEDLKKGMNF